MFVIIIIIAVIIIDAIGAPHLRDLLDAVRALLDLLPEEAGGEQVLAPQPHDFLRA